MPHHLINLLYLGILYSLVHSSYMGRQSTCAAMVACLHWMYSLIDQIFALSSASETGVHYHYLNVVIRDVFPTILMDAQLWNPSSSFNMDHVTTQIFPPYSSTVQTTDL